MEFIKKLRTAQIVTALLTAFIGLGAIDIGAAMLSGNENSPIYEIALLVAGALGIAGCVLTLLDREQGYMIAALDGVFILGLGIFRIVSSSPDVFLIDFLSVVFGFVECICGFALFKDYSKEHKKLK